MLNTKALIGLLSSGNTYSTIFAIIIIAANFYLILDKRKRDSALKRILSKSKDIISAGMKNQAKMYYIDTSIISDQMKYADNEVSMFFKRIGKKYESSLEKKIEIFAFRYNWEKIQYDILDSLRRILKKWSYKISLKNGEKADISYRIDIDEIYTKARTFLEDSYDDSIFPHPFVDELDATDFKDKMSKIFMYSLSIYNKGVKAREEAIEFYTKEVSDLLLIK